MSENNSLPELIAFSAIKIKISNGVIDKDLLLIGLRHYDNLMRGQLLKDCEYMNFNRTPDDKKDWVTKRETEIQGFYTNRGRFVDRREAWSIAHANGQIKRRVGGDKEKLFSENLY